MFCAIPFPRRTCVMGLALLAFVVLADRLAFDRAPGLGFAVVMAGLTAWILCRHPGLVLHRAGQGSLALVTGMILATTLDAGVLTCLMMCAGLIALALSARLGSAADPFDLLAAQWRVWGQGIIRPFRDLGLGQRVVRSHANLRRNGFLRNAWVWVLPILIGAVFIGLFSIANPVLTRWLGQVWDAIVVPILRLDLPTPVRFLFWVGIAAGVWALMRIKGRRRASVVTIQRDSGAGFALRALIVCNAVFFLQNCMDLSFLTGGLALPEGMTYAGYAHRGAYTLVVTALLAGIFALAWFRPGSAARGNRPARILVHCWLGQNTLLLAASVWRLAIYIEAYGLTRWRCAALIWMLLVTVGLGLIAWTIARDRSTRTLINANILVVTTTLAIAAFVNWAGLIASYNLEHCRERGKGTVELDIEYLADLGPGTLPTLEMYAGTLKNPDLHLQTVIEGLRYELKATSDWRSWTWRRAMLRREARGP